jgi:hypothetical protein
MKNKEFYSETILPVYEVTELTREEALLALAAQRPDTTPQGIISRDASRMETRTNLLDRRRH